jgi:4-amino-4-deoxy-L-arabinose transferase-like glycosyltransferase
VIPFVIGETLDPSRDHWAFGWEEGKIARSIAAGEGFSSPLFGKTGPTAWSMPVYPLLLAGVFKLFGIYTPASAWVILALNALFSALTCIPVYFIAARCFGPSAAAWSGWIWALFPYAVHFAVMYVWGYCLDTLMVALVIWATLELEERSHLSLWLAYGFLWGMATLTNPVILCLLPPMFAWIAWGHYKQLLSAGYLRMAAAMLVLTVTVAPWFVRNYTVFGRFIPFRSTFWVAFWEGNTGDTSSLYPDWTNPAHNDTELRKYQTMGEVAYVTEKRKVSVDFVRDNPGLYLRLSFRRLLYVWTGIWSLRDEYLAEEPYTYPNMAVCITLTILMFAGIFRGFRNSFGNTVPLVIVLACYPVVYYATHAGMEYRHPMDPVIVLFAATVLSSLWADRTELMGGFRERFRRPAPEAENLLVPRRES